MQNNKIIPIPDTLISSLLAGERFLIFTHVRPDGDAIGSAFGMQSFLRDQGKHADVVLPADPPSRYLKFDLDFLRSADVKAYDTIVVLDCAARERIADAGVLAQLQNEERFFNLDHHITNTVKAAFFDFVCPFASSACEIAAALVFNSGRTFSKRTATLLMAGILTDTGGFKFSNTCGRVLQCAAKLIDSGVDYEELINVLFFSKARKQLEFEGDLISECLRFACGGRFAYAFIPPELLEKHNFSLKEDEGLIDLLREIDGVVIAMLVHQHPEGFKVSLRSKDPAYPVAPIASKFGGGGHLMAAGATVDVPNFETLEKMMLQLIEDHLKK